MKLTEKEIEAKLEEYGGLIKSMAIKIRLEGYTIDDIIQELRMEFVKALERFDETQGVEFKTYFITYQRKWLRRALERQNRFKRPKINQSLNVEVYDGKLKEVVTFLDMVEGTELPPDQANDQADIDRAIEWFLSNDKDGYVLKDFFYKNLQINEIADKYNMGTRQIGHIKKRGLKKLREFLIERGIIDDVGTSD